MTKVYKKIVSNTLYNTQAEEYEHNFTVTPTVLKYIFKVNSSVKYNITLSLEELKKFQGFYSQSFITISPRVGVDTPEETVLTEADLVSLLEITLPQKRNILQYYTDSVHGTFPITLFVDSVTGDFESFSYRVAFPIENVTADFENTVSVTGNVELVNEAKPWKEFFSNITAVSEQSTYTAGDTINITVTTDPFIDYVYVENVVGLLDKTKVKLTNGVGSFSILTSSLSSGDEVEAKIGFKKYTGATKFKTILS